MFALQVNTWSSKTSGPCKNDCQNRKSYQGSEVNASALSTCKQLTENVNMFGRQKEREDCAFTHLLKSRHYEVY